MLHMVRLLTIVFVKNFRDIWAFVKVESSKWQIYHALHLTTEPNLCSSQLNSGVQVHYCTTRSMPVIWYLKSQQSIHLGYIVGIQVGKFSCNVKVVLEVKDKAMYHQNGWFLSVAVLWVVHRDPIRSRFMGFKELLRCPAKFGSGYQMLLVFPSHKNKTFLTVCTNILAPVWCEITSIGVKRPLTATNRNRRDGGRCVD